MRQITLLMLSLMIWNCGGQGTPSYEVTKMTLEEQEKNAPTSFLKVDGTYRETIFGETIIEGDIKSSATVAKFKDVVLTVSYYTKTNTHLGSENYVIYEFIKPGQKTHFKIKVETPSGTKKVEVDVDSAKTAD